jgi:hypothetical protein
VGGHEVKATASGHLVICSDCTWLRERFARELADTPELLARMEAAEGKVAKFGTAIDKDAKAEIESLAHDLQSARSTNRLAELGPAAADKLLQSHPQLGADLAKAKTLSGAAATEEMTKLMSRAEWIGEAEKMSLEDLEKLLDRPEFRVGTASGSDLRYVRYLKRGGTLPFTEWEPLANRIWENSAFGTLRERELKEAYDLGPKNLTKMESPNKGGVNFIPDHVAGNPSQLVWGQPYHFEEIKDWAKMSDTGNLSAMLDYVEKTNGSTMTIYYKSNTYMSGPLRGRIESLMKSGKVDLVPFVGEH